MNNKNITIIGAGIVGLATAYQLKKMRSDLSIRIIEKESGVSRHQTGNNSGVIHSGIYYKPGSRKALNCRHGYDLLLSFCDENEIEYDICGKVIVAVDEVEAGRLDNIYERGTANGLKGLRYISKEELKELEPHVEGVRGIHVPETGIIDYKKVARKLRELLEKDGVEFHFNTKVSAIIEKKNQWIIETANGDFEQSAVISCAGLHSDRIARMTNHHLPLKIIPFRGEYYKIKEEKKSLVNNLIYPVPDPAFPFLGVHFTRMIDGEVEAGPNAVFAFKREGYKKSDFSLSDTVESLTWPGFQMVIRKYWKTGFGEIYRSLSKRAFVKALQRLMPEITADDLEPGGAGIRAQACDKTGGLVDDFYFVEQRNVIHVCNAPSPAATSSLAIGETLAEKVLNKFDI